MAEKKKYTDYKNKYNTQAYDSLRVVVPKGRKAGIEAHARAGGRSVNGLVNDLLRVDMGVPEDKWGMSAKGVKDSEMLDDKA